MYSHWLSGRQMGDFRLLQSGYCLINITYFSPSTVIEQIQIPSQNRYQAPFDYQT